MVDHARLCGTVMYGSCTGLYSEDTNIIIGSHHSAGLISRVFFR